MNYKSEGYIIHKAWDFFLSTNWWDFDFTQSFLFINSEQNESVYERTELSSRHDVTTFHTFHDGGHASRIIP